MGTARVVADHPADGAPSVRRGVGAESQAATLGLTAQVVEHHSGLDLGGPAFRVDLDDARHVAAHVDHDGLVAGLPGQACTCTASQQGSPRFRSYPGDRPDVFMVAREDDAERDLAVVGRIARVGGAVGAVEAHLSTQSALKLPPESFAPSFA